MVTREDIQATCDDIVRGFAPRDAPSRSHAAKTPKESG